MQYSINYFLPRSKLYENSKKFAEITNFLDENKVSYKVHSTHRKFTGYASYAISKKEVNSYKLHFAAEDPSKFELSLVGFKISVKKIDNDCRILFDLLYKDYAFDYSLVLQYN